MLAVNENNPQQDTVRDELQRIDFTLKIGEKSHNIYFRSPSPGMALTAEARMAAALLPCMVSHQDYDQAERVDPRFLASLDEIQKIISTWKPALSTVRFDECMPATLEPVRSNERVATFFSGGLDSFHTLLKHKDDITDIIFVHGFDINLRDTKLRQETAQMVEHVGKVYGKNVIQVETNIRSITDRYIGWSFAHGPVLAAIGHIFSGVLGKVYIPASHTYTRLFPWGSHPLVDPLWSSRSLEFIHDGAEINRVNKTRFVAQSDVAMKALRVCWMNYDSAYNCGRCEKCQRTMINLRIANALDRCTTFPYPLRMENIRAMRIGSNNMRAFLEESLEAVELKGDDEELATALRDLLEGQNFFQRAINTMHRAISQPGLLVARVKRRLGLSKGPSFYTRTDEEIAQRYQA